MFQQENPTENISCDVEIKKNLYYDGVQGWGVFLCKNLSSGSEIVIKGNLPHLEQNEQFSVEGVFMRDKRFGLQIAVETIIPLIPKSGEALERYLSSEKFPGIGKKTAKRIVKFFGVSTIKVLDEESERLIEVKGLTKDKAATFLRSWEAESQFRRDTLFLYRLGIFGSSAQKIMEAFPKDLQSTISENPYILISHVKGFGFLKADALALSLGVLKDSKHRLKASILFLLDEALKKGHCYEKEENLLLSSAALLSLNPSLFLEKFSLVKEELLIEKLISKDLDTSGKTCLYLRRAYRAETDLAQGLVSSLNQEKEFFNKVNQDKRIKTWLDKYLKQSNIVLSEDQERAVMEVSYHPIFVLTGGPGVGKSLTSRIILNLFLAMKKSIALASPTGRAAKRLEELTGHEAKTIHRLLEWSPVSKRFLKSKDSPLDFDVVIVDEASMLDIFLADSLFKSLKQNAQIILIGDCDQLPSVGPGYVLSHLINSKLVPTVSLTKIFRQAESSAIVSNAHLINQGLSPKFDAKKVNDCHFIETEDEGSLFSVILDFFSEKLPKLGYQHSDIQLLSPMNKGELGCQRLNAKIQEFFHKKIPGMSSLKNSQYEFSPGDRVIQLSNDYDLGVFNGDIGYVSRVNKGDESMAVDFGLDTHIYEKDQISNLALAYSITIHKSQGSEFPVVIIPLSRSHTHMWNRNLIYTALTRAKHLAVLVGSSHMLSYAISQHKIVKRQSLLKDRILGKIS